MLCEEKSKFEDFLDSKISRTPGFWDCRFPRFYDGASKFKDSGTQGFLGL